MSILLLQNKTGLTVLKYTASQRGELFPLKEKLSPHVDIMAIYAPHTPQSAITCHTKLTLLHFFASLKQSD